MTDLLFDLTQKGYTVIFYPRNDVFKDCLFIRVSKGELSIDKAISRYEYDAVSMRNDIRDPEYLLKLYIKNMVQELETENALKLFGK